jgi:hypothetical protein
MLKKTFLLFSFSLIIVFLYTAGAMAQETEAAEGDAGGIGLTVGLDYWSNYYWRGTPYFQEDGVFFPTVAYDVMGSGLVLTLGAELSEDWVFDGKPVDTSASPDGVDNKDIHSTDFAVDYSTTIADMVSVGGGFWYFLTWNTDYNFMYWYLTAGLTSVPLSPTLTFYHDIYQESGDAKDFYVQLALSHGFELTKEAGLTLGVAGGYYNYDSYGLRGISDIDFSAALEIAVGIVTYTSSFHYIIVPTKDFYDYTAPGAKDINRFYASFGASVSL